ncbi:MAG TPA: metallophosphoesterase family protein [Verrucomicrobiae bacterium]|jgi:diadenosine tetraphosphatase ApaH/serine/threonine PP2A family protein phosphatase|nr:metallophosphoesterase family protein [Verrucomicrobiae bacterium]
MRVAVVSDIHANLVALDAVLAAIGSVDAIWQLGDIVGYGPDPDGVVERLDSIGALGVAGNHDLAALGGREIDLFNPDAKAAMEWTRGRIGDRTKTWLAALPTTLDAHDMTLVHGSPRDPVWEYVTSLPVARANLAVLETPVGLHGHTHVPMAWADRDGRVEAIAPGPGSSFRIDGRPVLLNPGSVGQPRDGDPTASWLEIDLDAGLATWRRIGYDIEAVRTAMLDAGLPGRLADRLRYGL